MGVPMVPEFTHAQPVVPTQRGQALAVKQAAVDHGLLAARADPATEHRHVDAFSFQASGDSDGRPHLIVSTSRAHALLLCAALYRQLPSAVTNSSSRGRCPDGPDGSPGRLV